MVINALKIPPVVGGISQLGYYLSSLYSMNAWASAGLRLIQNAKDKTMTISVKITHPSGERMRLSEHLVKYLEDRSGYGPFFFGAWLQVLPNDDIENLRKFSMAILEDRQDEFLHHLLDDVVSLVMIAVTAEAGYQVAFSAEDLFDTVGSLLMLTSIELLLRRGWIIVDVPLKLRPEARLVMEFTPAGMSGMAYETDECFVAILKMSQRHH